MSAATHRADALVTPRSSRDPAPLGLRLLLFAIPTSAALGGLVPGIGPLFFGRVLTMVVIVAAISLPRRLAPGTMAILPVAAIWLLFFAVGYIGNPDSALAVKMTIPVVIGLGTIAAFERVGPTPLVINSLLSGWVAAFVITGALGAREAATGIHLSNYLSGADLARIDTRLVASTFGNPNAFASFLVMVLPILAGIGLRGASTARRVLSLCLVGANLVLILVTGSRLGALSAALVLACIFLMIGARRALAAAAAGVAVGVALMVVAGDQLVPLLPGKVGRFVGILFGQGTVVGDASYSSRVEVYRDGVWLISQSHGLGFGPGTFEWNLTNSALPYPTGGIHSPHNAFLEIAVEAGLVTLAALIVWAWRAGSLARRAFRDADAANRTMGIIILSGFAGAIPMALSNSSWVTSATNWTWLGTMGALAAHLALSERRGLV